MFGDIRDALRDIERLLNRQNLLVGDNNEQTSALSFVRQASAAVHRNSSKEFLGERDLGYLLLLLHRLHRLFEQHRRLFDQREQIVIQEDLSDLVDENMAVSQQLATINRMYHTHQFLKISKSNRWFF